MHMTIDDSILRTSERISYSLRKLYLSRGYQPYHMSKFEEYDLYAGNKDFLVSDNVITFTDTDGKLMALKPDVTLSIIKNSLDVPNETRKVFYNENVYRVSSGTGLFKEIMQTGVECFGSVGTGEIGDVLTVAAESLQQLAENAVLAVSDLEILSRIVWLLKLSVKDEKKLYTAIGEKNFHEAEKLCAESPADAAEVLRQLLNLHGPAEQVLPQLDALLAGIGGQVYSGFRQVLETIPAELLRRVIYIDFSVTGDVNYYNGIVFKGFVRDIPEHVLSGGQYDRMMERLGRKSSAIGFAVYTDAFDFVDQSKPEAEDDGFLNVALPKGRLGEKIYAMFASAGFECPSILEPNRKLIFENAATGVRYFWVKPSDVPIYVERGAADIGVAGKDILLEYSPDVYEFLDLHKGICRMAVAAPKGFTDDGTRTLRVATKFPNIAKHYYRLKGRDIDIIHLNGSIEIAPILGLSDVIVDIVETGTTLKENNLEVIADVVPISARLIANKAAFKFKSSRIQQVIDGLSTLMEENV